jgi:hypothetical protein
VEFDLFGDLVLSLQVLLRLVRLLESYRETRLGVVELLVDCVDIHRVVELLREALPDDCIALHFDCYVVPLATVCFMNHGKLAPLFIDHLDVEVRHDELLRGRSWVARIWPDFAFNVDSNTLSHLSRERLGARS